MAKAADDLVLITACFVVRASGLAMVKAGSGRWGGCSGRLRSVALFMRACAKAACFSAFHNARSLRALRLRAGREQLATAKRRLAESFVVLEMDWLHLAAPLLCAQLGPGFCSPSVASALRAGGAAGVLACGLEATLAGAGEGERGEVAGLLARRNALDLELYAYARRLVSFPDRAHVSEESAPRQQQRQSTMG